jgi:hypothetical protein
MSDHAAEREAQLSGKAEVGGGVNGRRSEGEEDARKEVPVLRSKSRDQECGAQQGASRGGSSTEVDRQKPHPQRRCLMPTIFVTSFEGT